MSKYVDGIWMINETGFEEIRLFLARHHFNQEGAWEKNYLRALAERAERQMARGSPPCVYNKLSKADNY